MSTCRYLVGFVAIILLSSANAYVPYYRGNNRLFLDTADIKEWKELLPLGIFHGVTCNPTLLQQANEPCTVGNLHRLANIVLRDYNCNEFMCQSWGATVEDLVRRGLDMSALARDKIVVKVPVTTTGLQAASQLIQQNCRVCLTACYHHKQAVLAAAVGAEYLAPYLGRMTDAGKDGTQECMKMLNIVDGMDSDTRILVASLRGADTIASLAASGMDTFTFSPDVARQLLTESLTEEASHVFEQATRNNQ